jgi:hypothetical protein
MACGVPQSLPASATGRPAAAQRKLIDGIRYRAGTGVPWRDLPERYVAPSGAVIRVGLKVMRPGFLEGQIVSFGRVQRLRSRSGWSRTRRAGYGTIHPVLPIIFTNGALSVPSMDEEHPTRYPHDLPHLPLLGRRSCESEPGLVDLDYALDGDVW